MGCVGLFGEVSTGVPRIVTKRCDIHNHNWHKRLIGDREDGDRIAIGTVPFVIDARNGMFFRLVRFHLRKNTTKIRNVD